MLCSLFIVMCFLGLWKSPRFFWFSFLLVQINKKRKARLNLACFIFQNIQIIKFANNAKTLTDWGFFGYYASVFLKAGEVGYTKWECRYTWLGGHQAPKAQASREVWGYLPELFWALEFWKIMQFCAFGNQFLKNCGPKEKYQISLLELWEE